MREWDDARPSVKLQFAEITICSFIFSSHLYFRHKCKRSVISARLGIRTCASRGIGTFQEKVFQHEPALSGLQWGTAAKAALKLAINCDVFSLNVHNLYSALQFGQLNVIVGMPPSELLIHTRMVDMVGTEVRSLRPPASRGNTFGNVELNALGCSVRRFANGQARCSDHHVRRLDVIVRRLGGACSVPSNATA